MPSWSLLAGAPRPGETPGSARSARDLVGLARGIAVLGSLALLAGAASLLAPVPIDPTLPLAAAILGVVLLAAWRVWPARPLLHAASALLGAALAMVLTIVPWRLPLAASIAIVLVAPLLVGLVARAAGRGLETAGHWPRGRGWLESLGALPGWGALRAFGEGLLMPGLLLADALGAIARPKDRYHLSVDLDVLARRLQAAGADAERAGSRVVLRVPGGGEAKLRAARLAFPPLRHDGVLDARGPRDALRALRRLMDGPLADVGARAWSAPARRLEARLDALAQDARDAETMEERGLAFEEAERLARIVEERDFSEEEWSLLSAWKAQRVRAELAARMLSEPPGSRSDGRVLAAGPALSAPLARLVESGGLGALRRAVYVPFWILPVATRWGEGEVAINAMTGKPSAAESVAVLDACLSRPPRLLLEAARGAQFLPAPMPTAALLRELRGLPGVDAAKSRLPVHPEVVYVPFLPGNEGYVNALTGEPAPDLGLSPGLVTPVP